MHTLTVSTLPRTDTQTEVCFVLTGWWSGAPVRGLHPEGKSQVLPGSWGAGQPPVLPGTHIWGKGRHRDSTVARLHPLWSERDACHCRGMSQLRLLDQNVCFLCSYIINYTVCSHVDTNIFSGFEASELDEKMHSPRREIHGNLCPAMIQWSQVETHRKAAQHAIKAEQTSASFSWWAFLPRVRGRHCIYVGPSSDDNSLKLRPWMCLMDCYINSAIGSCNCLPLYCSWAARP